MQRSRCVAAVCGSLNGPGCRHTPDHSGYGSALIFAVFHGINPVFAAALVAGLVTGEIFRRSGSIWPA